jgi:hypothetical protein
MDLLAAERLNGRLWNLAKQGAFMCFLVACALLGASLMLSVNGDFANGQAHLAGAAPPSR